MLKKEYGRYVGKQMLVFNVQKSPLVKMSFSHNSQYCLTLNRVLTKQWFVKYCPDVTVIKLDPVHQFFAF